MKAFPIVRGGGSAERRIPMPLPKAAAVRFAAASRAGFATLMLWAASTSGWAAHSWEASPSQQKTGQFWRYHWYQRGLTNGNPAYESRFRVNAPEIGLHPTFGKRVEPRENGMMLIKAEEDLFLLAAAEFYCEAWGGILARPTNASQ